MLTDEGVISLDVQMCFFQEILIVILRNLRFVQRKTCTKESRKIWCKDFSQVRKMYLASVVQFEKFGKVWIQKSKYPLTSLNWVVFLPGWFYWLPVEKCSEGFGGFMRVCFVCFSWLWRLWVLVVYGLKVWIKGVSWVLLKSKTN